jgi:preprotein translocase subunit SecG
MTTVVIVIHLMVVIAMIGLVLLQRSEGGALGIGGGQGAFMTGRSAGNVLTRSTAVLALVFFITSLGLALIAKYQQRPADILERIPGQTAPIATETPAPPTPTGAPATAEELLQQLGGSSSTGGPQTPPATDSGSTPTPQAPAAPVPAPAAQDQAPATTAPATPTPPAGSGTSQ